MYKRILISAIAIVCCLATLPCAAQVTIKFKSLKISNVTDKIWEPEKDLFCAFRLPSYDRGDVYLRIEAEIVNEGDTAVPISNIDSENMTLVYRNPRSSSTVTSTLGCIIRVGTLLEPDIQPHSRRHHDYVGCIFDLRFDGMRPLYYVSAAVPTMRLCMEVPGQGLVYSDAPEEIIVNGRKIDPDWRNFDYSDNAYLLVNNELMREYMLENPHLFGTTFSEDLLMNEFLSHMAFIYHCSLISSPNN
jgi:hypothetical protein